jgi:RNA polymerase-binding transcription factor DksA
MSHAHPSRSDLDTFRTRLTDLVARLSGDVSVLRGKTEGATDPSGQGDAAARDANGFLAQSLLGQEEQVLAASRAALARLDAGTYGRCERCGEPISAARLKALPYTPVCIGCAQAAERQ